MNKIFIFLFILLLSFQWSAVAADSSMAAQENKDKVYVLVPKDWGIYNDGTHPVETTKGFNDALQWAHENGKTTFKVPEGTYLIKKQDPKLWLDTTARINMVPDMTFELDDKAVIQKETNGFAGYQLLHIGYGANNVTIKGGTYRGDKDTHDYSAKGTHEGGYGIYTEGAVNVTIDGVKAVNFTGDGLVVSGKGTMIQDLYETSFVSGSIDDKGNLVADSKKIRLKGSLNFNNPIFQTEREFEFSNKQKLPSTFDIFFYKQDGTFLTSLKDQKIRQIMQIPDGASSFNVVFNQAGSAGAYVEYWQRAVSKEVLVQNSEFAFNRRQGITIAGGDRITIADNKLHDIKGTAPQAGIDVEGGYGENGHMNSNIFIKNNDFYNNTAYDVVLYDGHDATVEGNHFASKGVIGLAVSPPFTSALIKDNHFDGTSIYAYHDVKFEGNQMNDSYTFLEGPNIQLDGMTFTDSKFAISSKQPFGVSASNITMNNNKNGSELSLWASPVHLSNIVLNGGGISGGVAEGSIFDNLKIVNAGGLNLPLGTYNNCEIESLGGSISGGIMLDDAGKYVFNQCKLIVKQGFQINNAKADVTITGSSFELLDRLYAFKAVKAKKVQFENNELYADQFVNPSDYMVMIGDYWTRSNPSTVQEAIIRGNTLTSNIEVEGISTRYAGTSNYKYTVENNVLTKAKVKLQDSDKKTNNIEQ
ncbi:right-handed parallel beta-helix repeat-containing protein [Paenibacillus sp. UNC451MF]|uniref:right-handed parallel beta-helix repeat-containing protein n=1 Tax=Paenibacillus sp. UNC451MF TaxID=1449063 RepID=UPI00048F728E|nr:right-handed parallel beta-helix repeat-containing protein [Paenibacillus sp. UNC451MF]